MHDKTHVVVIHGGETFDTDAQYEEMLRTRPIDLERLRPGLSWKSTLQESLGERFDVLAPKMPGADNAQYALWSLWFSRIIPLLHDNLILIGHSLGGIFLVRYLGENAIDLPIRATILIAPPFGDTPDESLASFRLPEDTSSLFTHFSKQAGEVHILHSTDDPVVPYEHAARFKETLQGATLHTFEDRKHFNDAEFPELVSLLTSLASQ